MPNAGSSARARVAECSPSPSRPPMGGAGVGAESSPVGSTPDGTTPGDGLRHAGLLDCQPDGSRALDRAAAPERGNLPASAGSAGGPAGGRNHRLVPPFLPHLHGLVRQALATAGVSGRRRGGPSALTSRRFRLAVAVTWVAVSGPLVQPWFPASTQRLCRCWDQAMWGPLLSILVQRRRPRPWLVAGRLAFVEAVTLHGARVAHRGRPTCSARWPRLVLRALSLAGLLVGWSGRLVRPALGSAGRALACWRHGAVTVF